MVGDLLVLGFTLSLDNFRSALALGPLRLRPRQAVLVALAFGFWDALAPLAGILGGRYLGERIGATGEAVGAIALGAYGLYLLVRGCRTAPREEFDQLRVLLGLPLPLSLDNVVAGTSLGLLGFSPWIAAPVFGAVTAVMSLAGLLLGRAAARLVPTRADVLSGAALVVMAGVLGAGLVR